MAVGILNDVLLPAMKEVGDLFGAGELILPFVLQSAEVMKKSVAHLERYLDKLDGATKGKVVLATVYGDVHDIGKNLVNTILANNGYTVYDLGKQVPLNTIIEKAIEVGADAIGLSALLVSTIQADAAVRAGAAPARADASRCWSAVRRSTSSMASGSCSSTTSSRTSRACSTAKTRSKGLKTWTGWWIGRRERNSLPARSRRRHRRASSPSAAARCWKSWAKRPSTALARRYAPTRRSPRRRSGARASSRTFKLDDVWPHMDLNTLFRLQWGAKNAKGDDYRRLLDDEFMPRLRELQRDAKARGWLKPAIIYGYFPVQADGNDLIVYDPKIWGAAEGKLEGRYMREVARFAFPRQPARERLCLADYFAAVDSGRMDVAALQVVTLGNRWPGRWMALAIRVPVPDGSVTDIVAQLERSTSAQETNARLREAAACPPLQGILAVSDDDLVSVDIIGNPHSSIVDAPSTMVLGGTLAKVLAWYDNEWGYACRLAELVGRLRVPPQCLNQSTRDAYT